MTNAQKEILASVLLDMADRIDSNSITKDNVTGNLRELSNALKKSPEEGSDEEKIKKLEDALKEVFAKGKKFVSKIVSGPDELGFYRVANDGVDLVASLNPFLELETDIKEGTEVIICEGIIEKLLPNELEVPIEPVEFKKVYWEDIKGLDSQVKRIRDTVEGPVLLRELYQAYKLEPSSGILLYGPPGTGKTMIAKAIATHIMKDVDVIKEETFIYLKGGEMLSKFVGEAENRIKSVFDKCRQHFKETGVRSTIFLDEAEALLPTRGSRKSSDVETTIVPTFLAEMDGLNKDNPFIILATNHPDNIDPAITRPGRIDLKIKINRPTKEDCIDILKLYYSKTLCKDDVEYLSKETVEFIFAQPDADEKVSGAVLKNVVDEVIKYSINRVKEDKKKSNYGITIQDVRAKFLESGI